MALSEIREEAKQRDFIHGVDENSAACHKERSIHLRLEQVDLILGPVSALLAELFYPSLPRLKTLEPVELSLYLQWRAAWMIDCGGGCN